MNGLNSIFSAMLSIVVCASLSVGCQRKAEPPSLTLLQDARFGEMWVEAKGAINSVEISELTGREILRELASLNSASPPEDGWSYDFSIIFQSGSEPLAFEVAVMKDRVLVKYGGEFFSGPDVQPFKDLLSRARGVALGTRDFRDEDGNQTQESNKSGTREDKKDVSQ